GWGGGRRRVEAGKLAPAAAATKPNEPKALEGRVTGKWLRGDAGEDLFEGRGELQLSLGESVEEATLIADFKEDGTFRMAGNGVCVLNGLLKAELGIVLTHEMSPELSGAFSREGIKLMGEPEGVAIHEPQRVWALASAAV